MTSNIGSREVMERGGAIGFSTPSQSLNTSPEAEYRRAAERTFSPEFLNRIDEIVIFSPLNECDIEQIIKLELNTLRQRLLKLGYTLRLTSAAQRELAQKGFSHRYGARALRRIIVECIEEQITELIMRGELKIGSEICISSNRGEFRITTKGAA